MIDSSNFPMLKLDQFSLSPLSLPVHLANACTKSAPTERRSVPFYRCNLPPPPRRNALLFSRAVSLNTDASRPTQPSAYHQLLVNCCPHFLHAENEQVHFRVYIEDYSWKRLNHPFELKMLFFQLLCLNCSHFPDVESYLYIYISRIMFEKGYIF